MREHRRNKSARTAKEKGRCEHRSVYTQLLLSTETHKRSLIRMSSCITLGLAFAWALTGLVLVWPRWTIVSSPMAGAETPLFRHLAPLLRDSILLGLFSRDCLQKAGCDKRPTWPCRHPHQSSDMLKSAPPSLLEVSSSNMTRRIKSSSPTSSES